MRRRRRTPGPLWRAARLERQREEAAAVEALVAVLRGDPVRPASDAAGQMGLAPASISERLIAFAGLLAGGWPEVADEVAALLQQHPHDPRALATGLLDLYRRRQ